jgi:hypothetical protein
MGIILEFDAFNELQYALRGFWSEVQRVYENRICTSLPSSLRIAWNGVSPSELRD